MDVYIGSDFFGQNGLATLVMFSSNTTVSCFNITILDVSVIENPESFTVILMSVYKGLCDTCSAVVNIEDNDGTHH